MSLYALLPYLILAVLVGAYLAAMVVGLMGRPKKKSDKKQNLPAVDPLGQDPVLDFGDELNQMQR
jgi:hypothetical protein